MSQILQQNRPDSFVWNEALCESRCFPSLCFLGSYKFRGVTNTHLSLSPGEGCKGLVAGSDPKSEGRQSAAAGGISKHLGQAEEVHRMGFQHHQHGLILWPSSVLLPHSKCNMINHSASLSDSLWLLMYTRTLHVFLSFWTPVTPPQVPDLPEQIQENYCSLFIFFLWEGYWCAYLPTSSLFFGSI